MTQEPAAQRWFAIEITAEPEAAEALEYAFNSLESLGTEINHLRKEPMETIVVVGYFNELPSNQSAQDEIHYAVRIYGLNENVVKSIERREIENQDWLIEWKKHWKPTDVAGFVIAPPWENVEDAAKIAIYIEPNMAFGTGTHETTQLCLKAIFEGFVPGESFLDVGTGTGILSIAAAKLNAAADISDNIISACDTDIDSIKIAIDNGILNSVSDRIDFQPGSISEATPIFDFVCANLTLDVILPNLPLLIKTAKRKLVLSGILAEQENSIVSELKCLQTPEPRVERAGEWIAIVIKLA